MISPFDIEAQRGTRRNQTVSDLLARARLEVSGISFQSTDQSPVVEDWEDPAVAEAARRRAEAAASAQELRAKVQGARAEAFEDARRGFEVQLETRLGEERQRLERLRLEFARDRQRFFAAAESQVVKLALAVARKILSRDALTEGLPLRATVKAALARVQDGTPTSLRVPETEADAWREMFLGGSAGRVEVVGDARMAEGECVLETKLGNVELGADAQMEEVERGFVELTQEPGY